MSSDRVNASPAALRNLAGALVRYQQEVAAASKSVQKALNTADWHDSQKDRFEARYVDLQRHIDRFVANDVTTMVKSLNALARKLDEIKQMRM